ncbi:uncharacterized protein [Ambystoma mexicanum]|uniref:uncharacterized protein n=1 Tax=Ambystoma mexicanum TaxID=8296 RepID=UPI0037E906C3
MAYLDDIAVFSHSWEEHVNHLGHVLKALEKANLTMKASKCQIGQSKVVYLGHEVGGGEIRPLLSKIEAVQNWTTPPTQTQEKAFLGLTGYYRNFIENYGTIASPLNVISSPKFSKKIRWNEECNQAFENLKKALCQAPVLRAPDYHQTFIVQTDAYNLCAVKNPSLYYGFPMGHHFECIFPLSDVMS